ncbi:hypothetical protein [Tropicimonas marinistellae]|uniref:hypothetical protein n=1 Tax=Tropicimonas marinistellae TaxID=1739787 RepID=UPI001917E25F|nr:hypothetical protein [Tropicimonas marinistellae]
MSPESVRWVPWSVQIWISAEIAVPTTDPCPLMNSYMSGPDAIIATTATLPPTFRNPKRINGQS